MRACLLIVDKYFLFYPIINIFDLVFNIYYKISFCDLSILFILYFIILDKICYFLFELSVTDLLLMFNDAFLKNLYLDFMLLYLFSLLYSIFV